MVVFILIFNVDLVLFDKIIVYYAKEHPEHQLFQHYADRKDENRALIGRIIEENIQVEVAHKNLKDCYQTSMNSVEMFAYRRKHYESDIR